MKIDNPRAGDMHFNVPDRSEIVPGPGDLQNHKFWSVFMGEKFSKKKKKSFSKLIFICLWAKISP